MHYVKQFKINGVDTKQVACIELQGVPNATTEGSLGVLGIDVTSPTHDVYKCVAVNGSIYTWELLSSGMSIMSATITGEGALTKQFPYTALLKPSGYIVKVSDLILDCEGYLYRVTAIGGDSCETSYCGTHIGGMASGDKDCTIAVNSGKLQLVTESGAVLGEVDYPIVDNETVYRNPATGKITAIGIKTINGADLRFFVGTQAEYNALTAQQKDDLFAIISDDNTKQEMLDAISAVEAKVEHLYLHTIRVELPLNRGHLELFFRITSPRATFDSSVYDLIRTPVGTPMFYDGVYTDDELYTYQICLYEYQGKDDEWGFDSIYIEEPDGTSRELLYGGDSELEPEIGTVQLY